MNYEQKYKAALEKAHSMCDDGLTIITEEKTELEQAAEAYENSLDYYQYTGDNPSVAFKAGAEWQKKQDELTPEDIGVIFSLVLELEIKYSATEGCYPEVLNRFKKYKEGKK